MDRLIPYLTVDGARKAIDFYKQAFAAEEVDHKTAEDGKRIMHGYIRINGHDVFLSDAFPEYGEPMREPASVTIHLEVEDADLWFERAVAAGATVKMPLDNQFWGARYGQLRDPFGHSWSVGGPVK